jgi:hypothetical protein
MTKKITKMVSIVLLSIASIGVILPLSLPKLLNSNNIIDDGEKTSDAEYLGITRSADGSD